eukprot:SAG22_NODE_4840_length_1153_cov_1.905123_1_plen_147_part_10
MNIYRLLPLQGCNGTGVTSKRLVVDYRCWVPSLAQQLARTVCCIILFSTAIKQHTNIYVINNIISAINKSTSPLRLSSLARVVLLAAPAVCRLLRPETITTYDDANAWTTCPWPIITGRDTLAHIPLTPAREDKRNGDVDLLIAEMI